MAWVQGQGDSAKVTLYANGQIHWNTAAHVAMGLDSSDAVGVFYDSDTNRLGFRREMCANCIGVLFNEDMVYSVDAAVQLADLGVIIVGTVTLDLHAPAPPTPPDNLGDEGIHWVNLP